MFITRRDKKKLGGKRRKNKVKAKLFCLKLFTWVKNIINKSWELITIKVKVVVTLREGRGS